MENLHGTEKEDASAILQERGLTLDQFLFKKEIEKPGATFFTEKSNVIITKISTKISKTYKSGHNSSWLCDFEKDLKANYFE